MTKDSSPVNIRASVGLLFFKLKGCHHPSPSRKPDLNACERVNGGRWTGGRGKEMMCSMQRSWCVEGSVKERTPCEK